MCAITDKKPLTGCEGFIKIIDSNGYYTDRTAYLKYLFDSPEEVENALFISPRRSGKTLNMSMIKALCELDYLNPGDTSKQHRLFIDNGRNFNIAKDEYKELRDKVMGQKPVVSVSFKGVEGLILSQL